MAHLKLFFPGLSNSNGLCNLLYGHSALASLCLNSQEQGCEMPQEPSTKKYSSPRQIPVHMRRYNLRSVASFKILRQKIENLTYVQDAESNDYWSENKDEGFVHALQLQDDEYRLEDVETVKSERLSSLSRKMSFSSDTESVQCLESVIVPIQ